MDNLIYFAIVLALTTLVWIFNKWKKRVILITHSGDYHLDEIFSTVVLLNKIKREGKFFQIIRTRNEKIFEKWRKERQKGREVYIYDVGNVYDEQKNEFDHHQIGGAGKRKNGIEYSSAGLVWKKFGEEYTGSKELAWKIEKKLVMAIDALDNGQEICEPKYDFFRFDLNNLIKLFLPNNKNNRFKMKFAFCKAVKLVGFILNKEFSYAKKSIVDEKKIDEIYKKAKDKRILTIYEPNISILSIVEKYPSVLFVISKKEKDVWLIQTIPKERNSFNRRKYLPKKWGGLNGYDLDKVTGVIGGIFCHRNVFIATAKTEKAAREMAEIALKNKE